MNARLTLSLTLACSLFVSLLDAAPPELTLDDIYDPEKKIAFSGSPQSDFVWVDDRFFLWPRTTSSGKLVGHFLVDAVTGKELELFDSRDLQAQVAKVEGVSVDDAESIAKAKEPKFHRERNALLLTIGDDLYVYTITPKKLTRLTRTSGEEEEASFSPDGAAVAFVRNNDLFVVSSSGGAEKRLTSNGSAEILNGKLDWVYQEEIYGRGIYKGYWWSPDSKSIAYLQLNEAAVPRFHVIDDLPYHQDVEVMRYPKAGDPNPSVKLFVVDVVSGSSSTVNLSEYSGAEPLIVDVSWQPDSRYVIYQVQNREQTFLDLNRADRVTGSPRRLLRETTKAWVEPHGSPQFLGDGSFLWMSERDGWLHIYRVSADGRKQTSITRGEWEARTLHGIDEKSGWIYFSGTERSHIGGDVYRIRLDGQKLERLSVAAGTHRATFNPSLTMYIDNWSDVTTPTQTRLHAADGKLLRLMHENRVPELAKYTLSRPEFLQVKNRDGFPMEAMLIRPTNFDPAKKYPVYQFTYAGPHAPEVKNSWRGSTYLFHQLLAQNGIIVWVLDNRSASGKGAASAWTSYKNFGETELRDLEDGVAWLSRQPWADPSRIVLSGWSFGGFMTAYALTHSKAFRAGIVGAPVTDWRDYDSVYTERVMSTPEKNAEGYRKSAPRFAAANVQAPLLLLHGTVDDNVHPQNTIQFAYELQKAGKQFDMMLYATQAHTFRDELLIKHMRRKMLEFILENVAE